MRLKDLEESGPLLSVIDVYLGFMKISFTLTVMILCASPLLSQSTFMNGLGPLIMIISGAQYQMLVI